MPGDVGGFRFVHFFLTPAPIICRPQSPQN
jgi:hypothetical protein